MSKVTVGDFMVTVSQKHPGAKFRRSGVGHDLYAYIDGTEAPEDHWDLFQMRTRASYILDGMNDKVVKDRDGLFKDRPPEPVDERLPVETINIWWSPEIKKWSACALVVAPVTDGDELLKRVKTRHDTFQQALDEVTKAYKGAK